MRVEGFTNVLCGGHRVRIAVRPFRVHVDQAHLDCAERFSKLAFAAIALVAKPRSLRPPKQFFGLPSVHAAAAETERLEVHRVQSDVARENHQVGPGQFTAVFLLDRPQKPARLIEVRIIRPAIERGETLLSAARAAAPVGDAIGARAMPRHPNEQPAVVAKVGGPPILRACHQGMEVLNHGVEVKALEFLGVIERFAHRVRQCGVLVENLEVQVVGPPVFVRVCMGPALHRARAFARHVSSIHIPLFPSYTYTRIGNPWKVGRPAASEPCRNLAMV